MDNAGIASRLRGLLSGQDDGDLAAMAAIAARLGVDEMSLRLSTDELSPYPTVDLLAAVVAAYGVDPTWLLTGAYSYRTHRLAEQEGKAELARSIQGMILKHTPARQISTPTELKIVREE